MAILQRLFRRPKAHPARRTFPRNSLFPRFWRRCRLEPLESRQMLSLTPAIHLGAVYFEDSSTHDQVGDVIEISFNGGAPGTQLTELIIDTDKLGDGLSLGDCLFDTESGELGAFVSTPFTILAQEGIDDVTASVEDGGALLLLKFTGFDAGEKFVFSIDVDEMGFLHPNAVAEGAEFEGSLLHGTFAAPHFYVASGSDIFLDAFDAKLGGSGLDLPDDDYNPPSLYMPPGSEPGPVYTAGAIFSITQTPLPITLSGHVYEDLGEDLHRDAADPLLKGVSLTLLKLEGENYVSTEKTAVTNAEGYYEFKDLLPGSYRVVETQPDGYFSVSASPGTVGGQSRGTAKTEDILTEIALLGGEDSVNNDFGEIRPSSISGRVHVDLDGDCTYVPGEPLLAGVLITLRDGTGNTVAVTTTDAQGEYVFTGLRSGVYSVAEQQPDGYLNGCNHVGSVGGTKSSPDLLSDIPLPAATDAVRYDFCEVPPVALSGYVYYDVNWNGLFDGGEQGIAGATVALLDAAGNPTGQTAVTDEKGFFSFTNLYPGAYGLAETQPEGYLDGIDTAGTAGGTAQNPGDRIDRIVLMGGITGERYLFGEIRPASVAGRVYADQDLDYLIGPDDLMLAGVTVYLLDAEGNQVASTTTNEKGEYRFDNLAPGAYGVREVQPAGYLDGPDYVGSVGGTLAENDLITQITLGPGVDAVEYNFCEIPPASIAGRVYADMDLDYQLGAADLLLSGVTVYLIDANGDRLGSTQTDERGEYLFANLTPGKYGVEEVQPAGYLDGPDYVGSAGGTLAGNDLITQVQLGPGVAAVRYDFCELLGAKISGYVFQDGPVISVTEGDPLPEIPIIRDGQFTSDDAPLAGVLLQLCDGNGAPLVDSDGNDITTVTDADGYYEFTNLTPGKYGIVELQPEDYYPGIDTAGSVGGLVVNRYVKLDPSDAQMLAVDPEGSSIVRIGLMPGDDGVHYNFSEVRMQTVPKENPPENPPDNPPNNPPDDQPGFIQGKPPTAPTPPPSFLPGGGALPGGSPYVTPPMLWASIPYGGAGEPGGYSWHLSIINGGQPRNGEDGDEFTMYPHSNVFDPATWTGPALNQSELVIADAGGAPVRTVRFGLPGAIPIIGDWDGDGIDEAGVFYDGNWFFDLNGDGVWDENDLWAKLGDAEDQPVVGDWDGDGKSDIGIFGPAWTSDHNAIQADPGLPDAQNNFLSKKRPKNVPPDSSESAIGWRTLKRTSAGPLRSDVIDHVFEYGSEDDRAVVGDWNGDGVTTIGVFRNGTWFLDVNGTGRWDEGDVRVRFGREGDVPVVGDWTGDGASKLGVYRHGVFHLDVDNNRRLDATDKVFALGHAGDQPFAGDFTGNGVDTVGVYRDGAAAPAPTPAAAN
ncbi:MAG: carboxypeptidase regulatory-like domain-containing protein [Pirellulales bacterium]|nr:carboxypeptidase regulatory-like domain-containing protein [Pirellulales bacterium]